MFFDTAKIYVKAGDGGDGAISFHREKYVAAGGPDGGDGGNGGDIIFETDPSMSTLADFRYKRKYVADNGENGRGAKCFGKNAEPLIIKVPEGTLIKDFESGRLLADMTSPNNRKVLLKGGRGGWGNTHFKTPTRQVPRFAKGGLKGMAKDLSLELKLIADVGLVGFPNVGKSTFLSCVTKARPKIANYHFTTLEPNLGVCDMVKGAEFVIADIPGLIEGASEGVGLGHEFLKHIERTRLLVHIVDVSSVEGRNPIEDFDIINKEIENYNPVLKDRVQIVAANKIDVIQDSEVYEEFLSEMKKRGITVFEMSVATMQGVGELINHVGKLLSEIPKPEAFEPDEIPEEADYDDMSFEIRREDGAYVIDGRWVENIAGSVNLDDDESFSWFQRMLRMHGIIDELEKMGICEGDIVRIYDIEFEYIK